MTDIAIRLPDGDLARVEDATMKAGAKRLRRIGTIEEWFNRDMISKAEYVAAERFLEDYQRSRLDPRYATCDLTDTGGGGQPDYDAPIVAARDAYERVQAALAAVGPARHLLVDVVCEGKSIRAVAGGGVQAAEARGMLRLALHVLAGRYLLGAR